MFSTFNAYKNMILIGIILILITGVGSYVYFTYRSLNNQIAQYKLNETTFTNTIIDMNVELNNAESNAARLRTAVADKTSKEVAIGKAYDTLLAEHKALKNAPPTIIYRNETVRDLASGKTSKTVSEMLHAIAELKYENF